MKNTKLLIPLSLTAVMLSEMYEQDATLVTQATVSFSTNVNHGSKWDIHPQSKNRIDDPNGVRVYGNMINTSIDRETYVQFASLAAATILT